MADKDFSEDMIISKKPRRTTMSSCGSVRLIQRSCATPGTRLRPETAALYAQLLGIHGVRSRCCEHLYEMTQYLRESALQHLDLVACGGEANDALLTRLSSLLFVGSWHLSHLSTASDVQHPSPKRYVVFPLAPMPEGVPLLNHLTFRCGFGAEGTGQLP